MLLLLHCGPVSFMLLTFIARGLKPSCDDFIFCINTEFMDEFVHLLNAVVILKACLQCRVNLTKHPSHIIYYDFFCAAFNLYKYFNII